MTSLNVICGLDPPIKNPGYAYGPIENNFFRPKRLLLDIFFNANAQKKGKLHAVKW